MTKNEQECTKFFMYPRWHVTYSLSELQHNREILSNSVLQSAGYRTEILSSWHGNLCLDCEPILPTKEVASAVHELSPNLWHQRLGHVNVKYLQDLSQKEMVTGMKLPKEAQLSFCEGCVEGKMHRQPFKPVGESHRSSRKLQLVHSDVCGPMDESIGGKRYFVSFIGDYSRCCVVYFIKKS